MTRAHKNWMDKLTSMYFPKEENIPEAARLTKAGGTEMRWMKDTVFAP